MRTALFASLAAGMCFAGASAAHAATPINSYPDQYEVSLDPNAAPAPLDLNPAPLLDLKNALDFFLVTPGGVSEGGGSH